MNTPDLDATIVSTNSWFKQDYRSTSPFRGKQVVEIKTPEKSPDPETIPEKIDSGNFGKYSLVIVIPSTAGGDNCSDTAPEAKTNRIAQSDSGVGSMSPSPPKTPTPDYDSLEDFFDDEYYATAVADGISPASLPLVTVSTKKVHFSMASDSSDDSDDKSPTAKSSWRDALVVNPVDYQDHLIYCYRQDWVKGENVKSKTLSQHPLLTTTTLKEDLVDQRSRTVTRRRRNTKLVRRSSSLDRLAELRYSYRNVDRTPLLCDPDPLKVPSVTAKKNLGRRGQRLAALER